MSHRSQPAPILYPAHKASRGVHPHGPEASRGVYPHGPEPRSGLTLIEMLVALAVTLVMMAAVVNLFANISGSIRNRRAVIEVTGQLRQVRQQLALDLAGATCKGNTWQRSEYDPGYIEIIEGEWSDTLPSILVDGDPDGGEIDYAISLLPSGGDVMTDLTNTNPPLTQRPPQLGDVTNGRALGDWDDILALTVRSESRPFRAMVPLEADPNSLRMEESPLAEVVWYAMEERQPSGNPAKPDDGFRRVYRRVFLILPSRGPWPAENPPANVSVRQDPITNQWVANTLGDLTKRENRAARKTPAMPVDFPFPLLRGRLSSEVEHMVLSDALAFDVRVYDPGAPLYETPNGTVVQPGDPGWIAETMKANPIIAGYGAYCDLGWAWNPVSRGLQYNPTLPMPTGIPAPLFNTLRQVGWHPRMITANSALRDYPCVYDTWSFHYENDGIDHESVIISVFSNLTPPLPALQLPQFLAWQTDTLDQGTNGLDDDNVNGVDDPGERETSPPYDVPLRGIKVSLRVYERDARQIRETSVTHALAN